MANKKIIMTVTAAGAIAATFAGADEAEAASYKVQSGDSLWSIAQKHNTSVQTLMEINKLTSDVIYPKQVLETDGKSSSKAPAKPESNKNSNTSTKKTYTVKSGDTLSGIASKHGISLSNLMKWNSLDTTLIFPGNVFVVSESGKGGNTSSGSNSSNDSGSNTNKPNDSKVDSSSVYTVKSGDTLSRIGLNYGVSVANLKKWNSLSSDMIYIGQKLNIGAKAGNGDSPSKDNGSSSTPTADVDYDVDKLISVAKSFQGVKYVWGGSSPSGFDCSGFIHYVYNQAGYDIGRYSSDGFFDRSYYVNKPQVGDLVFFENTYKAGISHLGIYLGDNKFIHAGSSGVQISSIASGYWKDHFDSFKRFY
ncbi:LysM peptidoglycan-binding domain-containing protein [Oceanobacillus bengalensis]|uniref:Peptidoglycan endopeptidase n=1 Tax=Oceanobacillus bengalensis TaxID=1435466 RepID=A0A494YSM8_9BACI|nr:peptidoglycan endopeptidase [Oceanobacillus bengalensis]RKQ12975.1 peptidoglycan endopeptidase [Oceanobacillus bengalensis]